MILKVRNTDPSTSDAHDVDTTLVTCAGLPLSVRARISAEQAEAIEACGDGHVVTIGTWRFTAIGRLILGACEEHVEALGEERLQ